MVKNKVNVQVFVNMDYIVYLMLIPSIAPIIYINMSTTVLMTFYGGFYILTCCILIFLCLLNGKVIIYQQDKVCFSKKALFLFFLTTFISLSYSLVSKYLAFQLQGSDAGIFMSMIRDIFYGKFGYATSAGVYHLERHQNYILFLLSTIYFITFKSMIPILICNAAAIFGAGVFLYKTARVYFNQLLSLVIAFTFYASPVTSAFSGFYPEIYYVLALSLLFYLCITKKNSIYIILATCLLVCIKEEAILYMPGFLFILWQHKRFKLFGTLLTLIVAVGLVNIIVVEPYFLHKNILIGVNNPNIISTFFTKWGGSYGEIIFYIMKHPIEFIQYCFNENSGFWLNYRYWFFLPLLSPFVLLSSLLIISLDGASSENMDLHQMTNYHSFGVGIIAFIGMILVFRKFILWQPQYKQKLHACLLFIMLSHPFTFINYSALYNQFNQPSIFWIDSFMRTPIDFFWWRAFYKVNLEDLEDFNKMSNYLIKNYHNAQICVGDSIYNNMLDLDLPSLQKRSEHLYQKNCIITFAYDKTGMMQPHMSEEDVISLNILIQNNKCNIFGKFYVCNNLSTL